MPTKGPSTNPGDGQDARRAEAGFLGDPVAAYDRMAPFYDEICSRRRFYLDSIDRLVSARIPAQASSLLDVGAGNGERGLRIARSCGLDQVVLVEPSSNMIAGRRGSAAVWPIRAEQLSANERGRLRGLFADPEQTPPEFDVILCLWNVLGHIRPPKTRVSVLQAMAHLLSPRGKLFLDLTHRYNAHSYGLLKSLGRFLEDQLMPRESNGDVTTDWKFGESRCSTYGHVFTVREAGKLFMEAELRVEELVVVDYDSGDLASCSWQGNLFYVLTKT